MSTFAIDSLMFGVLSPGFSVAMASEFPVEFVSVQLADRVWKASDTPWVSLADVVIDGSSNSLVGLTFAIDSSKELRLARNVVRHCNPSVCSIRDDPRSSYRWWFDVVWQPSNHRIYTEAQLCCGQWHWWYECDSEDPEIEREIPVAVSLGFVSDLLASFEVALETSRFLEVSDIDGLRSFLEEAVLG